MNLELKFCLLAFASVVLISHCQVDGDDSILKKMKNYDAIYMASLTVKGLEVEPPASDVAYLDTDQFKWTLTLDSERRAIIRDIFKPDLRYHSPDEFKDFGDEVRGVSFDEDGNFGNTLMSKKAVSFGNDHTSWAEIWTTYIISKQGKLLSQKDDRSLQVYGPDDETLTLPVNQILWCLGRGFSERVTELVSSKNDDNGLVDVVGNGFGLTEQQLGRWVLKVDPNNQYLVRKAAFYFKNSDNPLFTLENIGLKTEGETVFPVNAKFDFSGIRVAPVEYEFHSCSFVTSESLIKDAITITSDKQSPRTLFQDHTVVPEKTTYVNSRGVSSDDIDVEFEPRKSKFWLYFFAVLSIVMGAIVVMRLKSNKD